MKWERSEVMSADKKIETTGQSPRSTGSLIGWLVVAVVVLLLIYQVFDIAVASS